MKNTSSRWPWVVALLGLAAMALAAFFFRETRALPGDLIDSGRSIAEAFRTGTVTTQFVSYATEVSGSQRLQFATLDEMEVFERTDSTTVLWGQLALPDVVVRAEAPVTYTYYLDLEGRWEFTIRDRVVLVQAPPIRSNTPAIDVSRISYEVETRSFLRNETAALENLRRGLTDLAKRRSAENIPLVRELGRKKTEEFVRTWLLSSYEDAAQYHVDVVFADESKPAVVR
ncbi:MAG TPA: hypothetical protein VLK65_16205 [Vicinamibacteria bacterium]|nr:hypothetical protein [Vicinamibacteria bacterium]